MPELLDAIRERIRAAGPIGFDEYVAHALYTPGLGFYTGGGGAGRRRDFLTSPEVGPLFGAVMAGALDAWWDEFGRPNPFWVVEAGAGPGTLARSVRKAAPRCTEAMHLVLVEPADVQWATHPGGVTSRTDLPRPGELGSGPVVVLANELLDNLPFGLAERTGQGWAEVQVGVDGAGDLVEVLFSLDTRRAEWCSDRTSGTALVGARIPIQSDAAAWLGDALALIDGRGDGAGGSGSEAGGGGRLVVIDYCSTTPELASRPWREWVRTYAGHGPAGAPLDDPGRCDITVEVAVDQLGLVRPPTANRSQREFLTAHGMEELVAEGRDQWKAEGLAGGLPAIAARSRAIEEDALVDPSGLGAFRVLEWAAT